MNLLQMFQRFAELSQPYNGHTLAERLHLLRDIPEEIRRLMAMAETQSIGNAGEGWRFLKPGETVQEGDECRTPNSQGWSKWCPCVASIGCVISERFRNHFRRRVKGDAK